MYYTGEIFYDNEFLNEYFDESLKIKKLKKIEDAMCVWFLLLSIIFHLRGMGSEALLLLVISLLGLLRNLWIKPLWMIWQRKSPLFNTTFKLVFDEEFLKLESSIANNELRWQGVADILETSKGVFLKLQRTQRLYLPKRLLSDEAIAFIMSQKSKCFKSNE